MTLREFGTPVGSPDDAQVIVGNEGEPVAQSGESLITISDISAESNDYDIDDKSITDATDVVLASPEQIGGTAELSGALVSEQGEPFTVEILWEAADGQTTLYRETVIENTTDVIIEAVTTKSDYASVVATDASAQNTANSLNGTLNFH